jgi:TatD DNase family protein
VSEAPPALVDTHAHLDMSQFDPDLDGVVARAREAGVRTIVTIGTGNPAGESVEKTLRLAEGFEGVFAGLGVHPHDARLAGADYWKKLDDWLAHPRVVLWGEIGLDYYYDHSPREVQREVFVRQVRGARERRIPIAIHCRDAWPDMMSVIRQEWHGDVPGGILHSFTGTSEQALECAGLGFLVSFSGILTFKNASRLREAARALPEDALLVETDAPYLAPVPHRGKRNEPAFVSDVARCLAEVRGVGLGELAAATTRNARRLLGLEGSGQAARAC